MPSGLGNAAREAKLGQMWKAFSDAEKAKHQTGGTPYYDFCREQVRVRDRVRVRVMVRVRVRVRGLWLGLANPNPKPNPNQRPLLPPGLRNAVRGAPERVIAF